MVAAREVARDPKVLVAAQPTRGLDVGAIEYLHRRLVEERDEGRAILLVSLELDEVLSLSDRILVMYEGQIVGEHESGATEEEIGLEMLGGAGRRRRRERAAAPRQGPQPRRSGGRPADASARGWRPGSGPAGSSRRSDRRSVAFLIGGIVIAATGHNPFQAYWDIIKGAGLNWLAHPWDTDIAHTAPYNFSQTLLQTTTLILCGLAVAFAFRCGLFNIGGNGQYLVGLIFANWIGVSFVDMARPAHILLGIVVAAAAGAVWAGIAGFLKATVGAHEVITTIMLNWIAYYLGVYVFQQGGPLQAPKNVPLDIPISADVVPARSCPSSGACRLFRACTSASSSRSGCWSSSG